MRWLAVSRSPFSAASILRCGLGLHTLSTASFSTGAHRTLPFFWRFRQRILVITRFLTVVSQFPAENQILDCNEIVNAERPIFPRCHARRLPARRPPVLFIN